MRPYDYTNRQGVEEIGWERFNDMARALVEALANENVDAVIGVARAGLFPATAVACMLRRELYPVRITRRYNDEVTFDHPVWRVDVPATIRGLSVAVIDEIADSGETLAMVKLRALDRDAGKVVTASLVTHSWAYPKPDYTALVSDAFVVFPWDRQVFSNGKWQAHPEIEAGLKAQKK
jgi:hypothetical protein